jgi:hypothetical protein
VVTGAITTVILPGLGAVCPECFGRGFISGGLPIDGHEIYTFSMTGPDSELNWDIARAQELLAQRPRKPKKLDPVELADWLRSRVTITPSHLDHIPVAKRAVPGIFVVITVAARPGAPMLDFGILIDGSHRAALALRDGRDFYAYLLTEPEQRSICTYTVEGTVTEIPLIAPGPGITAEDAGL